MFFLQICHSKSGDINPVKIKGLIEAYVDKCRKMRKYIAAKDRDGQEHANGIQKPKQWRETQTNLRNLGDAGSLPATGDKRCDV